MSRNFYAVALAFALIGAPIAAYAQDSTDNTGNSNQTSSTDNGPLPPAGGAESADTTAIGGPGLTTGEIVGITAVVVTGAALIIGSSGSSSTGTH